MFMKKPKAWVKYLLAAGFITLALTGFQSYTKTDKQPLVVERQECVLQFMAGFIPSHDIDIGMTVDVPVDGNQVLIDSVMRLLNEAVYEFLESGKSSGFAPEQVYCSDNKNFVKHYYEAYKPLIADTSYEFEWDGSPGPFTEAVYLTITLIDQTDKFVTYEIVSLYLGEGAEYNNEWFTFSKADGHRLRTIVNDEDVPKLLKCTSGTDHDVWDDVEYRFSIGGEVSWRCNFGLTTDSLWCQYFYAPGIEETFPFDMKTARPYLSKEAKELLK
jgi:hypothetical protein